MIVAGSASPLLLASAAGGYNLTNSLRFRSSASAYLNRTPASDGNSNTWTWSAWVKRGSLGTNQNLFGAGADGSNYEFLQFSGSDVLNYALIVGDVGIESLSTTAVYRDPSAWYHIVLARNGATRTVYVNNVSVLSGGSSSAVGFINQADPHAIARRAEVAVRYFDGYMTEVNFIDGQALTPSSFGETSATTGVWQPKKYAGSYGTNGFYLPFTDNSALTTSSNVGLGKDFSGNGNYWTTNNISITAGVTYDSMTDVPTLTSATASNFAVINPLENLFGAAFTVSEANLKATATTTLASLATIALPSSSKYYFEYLCNGGESNEVGLYAESTNEWRTYDKGGQKYSPAGYAAYGASWTTNDLIGVAVDMTSGKLWFSKNGVYQASGDPAAGTNAAFTDVNTAFATEPPFFYAGAYNGTHTLNFGQRPFAYTPPTGFVALNTFNLPTPTIGATASTQAGDYFNVVTYTGNDVNGRSITGFGFNPDFVWVKSRNITENNVLSNTVTGGGQTLYSNLTIAEQTNEAGGYIASFVTDGFTVSAGGVSDNAVNDLNDTYVSWAWRASNATAVSNTAGSITSTVSANTSAGFSVVTYTGTGANATVGHGLGVAPSMVIVKSRSIVDNWRVGHNYLNNGSSPWNYSLILNATVANLLDSTIWNNTAPTSSVFSIGTDATVNQSSATYVAYCFSEVAGYSKFGSYTGNGSTDGTFTYLGFSPKFIMLKRTDTTENWIIYDAARDTYNVAGKELLPNSSAAEGTYTILDFLSNGFKLRNSAGSVNASGGTFIYAAFAETPTKFANAR
jgi:hypothetical protein